MEYTIDAARDGHYIQVKVKGPFSRRESMQLIVEAYDRGHEQNIDRYLVDLSEAQHDWSFVDDYEFLHEDLVQQPRFNRYARNAVLVAPGDTSYDFIVTASRNTGLNVKLFHEREQALAFLGIEAVKSTPDEALPE